MPKPGGEDVSRAGFVVPPELREDFKAAIERAGDNRTKVMADALRWYISFDDPAKIVDRVHGLHKALGISLDDVMNRALDLLAESFPNGK